MKNTLKNEPVTIATLVGLVVAAIGSYGIGLTPELEELLIVAVPVLIAAWIGRSQVTPIAKTGQRTGEG